MKEKQEKGEGSLEVASLFPALKMKVIDDVLSKFPDLDKESVCSDYITVNQKRATPKWQANNRAWFERFVIGSAKRQRDATASADTAKPKLSQEEEEIRIARLPRLVFEIGEEGVRVKGGKYKDDKWTLGGKEINEKTYGIRLDYFLSSCRNMKEKTEEEAHKYLCGLIGEEWNTKAAFWDFSDVSIYSDLFNGTEKGWEGVLFEPAETEEDEKAA
jgi:hypothetical protein